MALGRSTIRHVMKLRIGDRTITRVGCGDVRLATAASRGVDAREVERALHAALELGLMLLDAADEEAAERLCGEAVRALRLRDRVVVACRVPELPVRPGAGRRDTLPERLPVGYVQQRIEASLRATRLDALPLAQLPLRGAWRASAAWPELVGACERLVREGKVLAWGALCGGGGGGADGSSGSGDSGGSGDSSGRGDGGGSGAATGDVDLLREPWLASLSIPYSLCERGAEAVLLASIAAAADAAARAARIAADTAASAAASTSRAPDLAGISSLSGVASPAALGASSGSSGSSGSSNDRSPSTTGTTGTSSGPASARPPVGSGPAGTGSSLILAAAPDILAVLSAAGAADPIAAAAVLKALDAPPRSAPAGALDAAGGGGPPAITAADAIHRADAPIEPKLILARRPLAGGALAGTLGPGAKLGLRDDRSLDDAALERIAVLAARLALLVEREPPAARSCEAATAAFERGRRPDHVEALTLAELALRFVLTRGAVALPRLHRAANVPEALAAAAAPPLSQELLDRLDDLLPAAPRDT